MACSTAAAAQLVQRIEQVAHAQGMALKGTDGQRAHADLRTAVGEQREREQRVIVKDAPKRGSGYPATVNGTTGV